MLKRSKGLAILIALSLFICITAAQTLDFNPGRLFAQEQSDTPAASAAAESTEEKYVPAPVVYGIPTDSLEIVEGTVERGEVLSQLLAQYNIDPTTVHNLAQKAKDVFNVRRIASGRNYMILHQRDSAQTANYFIYEPNQVE